MAPQTHQHISVVVASRQCRPGGASRQAALGCARVANNAVDLHHHSSIYGGGGRIAAGWRLRKSTSLFSLSSTASPLHCWVVVWGRSLTTLTRRGRKLVY